MSGDQLEIQPPAIFWHFFHRCCEIVKIWSFWGTSFHLFTNTKQQFLWNFYPSVCTCDKDLHRIKNNNPCLVFLCKKCVLFFSTKVSIWVWNSNRRTDRRKKYKACWLMIILKSMLWFKCAPSIQEKSLQFMYYSHHNSLHITQNTKLVEKRCYKADVFVSTWMHNSMSKVP